MCDEFTEADTARWMQEHALDRRRFGLAGVSAAALALFPAGATGMEAPAAKRATASRSVAIRTPDGTADAFFVFPADSNGSGGKHPAMLLWPDIAGLRDAYKVMATRLAAEGYAVLAVNPYYRSAPAPIVHSLEEWRTPAGRAKLEPMMASLTPAGTISDAAAFIDWLDTQPEVDNRHKVGTFGYCMGGPFAVRAALARPQRVGMAASFHGANMVNDTPDSPHRQFAKINAALLIAIAQNDDARQPEARTELKAAAQAAGRPAEVEVYPAQHGWCTIDAPVYDPVQAEKAWERMLAIARAAL